MPRPARLAAFAATLLAALACEQPPVEPARTDAPESASGTATSAPTLDPTSATTLICEVSYGTGGVALGCAPEGSVAGVAADPEDQVYGTQNQDIRLTSSNSSYDSVAEELSMDVTVQNLLRETVGTPDGVNVDPNGVRVFFATPPYVVSGTGTVSVLNPDGVGTFVGQTGPTFASRPYYQYPGMLVTNAVSSAKRWRFGVPTSVGSFRFGVRIATKAQPLLVINEVALNPGGTVQDSVGEYVEVLNIGGLPVNMNGMILSDNAPGIADTINVDLLVLPGEYALLGRSSNTAKNGNIQPDYLWTRRIGTTSTSISFSNSGSDLFKIRTRTNVLVDSVFYTSGTTTAVAGVARELRNPYADNTLVDGSNWGAATPFYDAPANTNRGTPGFQNSVFAPPPDAQDAAAGQRTRQRTGGPRSAAAVLPHLRAAPAVPVAHERPPRRLGQ